MPPRTNSSIDWLGRPTHDFGKSRVREAPSAMTAGEYLARTLHLPERDKNNRRTRKPSPELESESSFDG